MDWEQKVTKEIYEGDQQRFEKSQAYLIQESTMDAIHWNDLKNCATILPNLEEVAKNLILQRLGYLPHYNVTLPFEPYLRSLLQSYASVISDQSRFILEADEHIKLIRNEDMKCNTCIAYDNSIYQKYHATFHPYGYTVKERIELFLGYEPDLECSLVAELWLRDIIAKDNIKLSSLITPIDYKTLTLIKYREALLKHGELFANQSALLGDIF